MLTFWTCFFYSDGKLLNSEFLNGENIPFSNREAVSRLFMASWPMGSKILSKVPIQFLRRRTKQHLVDLGSFICTFSLYIKDWFSDHPLETNGIILKRLTGWPVGGDWKMGSTKFRVPLLHCQFSASCFSASCYHQDPRFWGCSSGGFWGCSSALILGYFSALYFRLTLCAFSTSIWNLILASKLRVYASNRREMSCLSISDVGIGTELWNRLLILHCLVMARFSPCLIKTDSFSIIAWSLFGQRSERSINSPGEVSMATSLANRND